MDKFIYKLKPPAIHQKSKSMPKPVVFAVKNRAAKARPLVPEVITIPSEDIPKVSKQQVSEPKVIYSKLWSETYQSNSLEDFIGNSKSFSPIKKWLSSWNDKFDKSNDDEYDIPTAKSLFIHGPNGVGKTSFVYAIAKECGYKVLEYNSSSQKLSPSVLQKELLESSQSHCIGANKNSIAAFFQPKNGKKVPEVKKVSQSQNAGISKSLILFDDIDAILYEDRSDLWKTIRQTIRDARKPIIFTSLFDLTFLTSEVHIFLKLKMETINSEAIQQKLILILKTETQLADSVSEKAILWKYISLYSGDIRQAINQLQFWSKKKSVHTERILKHGEPSLDFHSQMLNLLSLEDCLTATHQTMSRNIDEYICDYNLFNYHRIPSLSFVYEQDHSSLLEAVSDCLHESLPYNQNYDRYLYDLKHFSR